MWYARAVSFRRPAVIGLIAGWGDVAIHGDEGFRAARARVICLFDTNPWSEALDELGWEYPTDTPRPALAGSGSLRLTASTYHVPLLSLRTAASHAVLSELGVSGDQITNIELAFGQ